ncbi:hypothetical protein [Seonamhaeicola maritimus]|uniref:Uncharacterized protein n=1 Tax=Seonamhaeicola maritimus TaxID=2591822 RepID=A0A5C7GL62_9FLAO|nr:hypothetical protein [Seonamhaeicola maritimus]TXG38965.1 hypothetical protein FUA22_03495 [Seonamhaeicola maritimus]
MKKTILPLALFLCMHSIGFSQVGIGTTNPTAELEIETTNTGIPALELNSQTTPSGTVTGQISLIGDKLFMYDATRIKWLSLETTALQYGRNGGADNERLRFGGDLRANSSGPKMPFDGTIVYMTIQSSGGEDDKQFDLKINGTDVGNNADPTLDGRISLSSGTFTSTSYNIDFNVGDYITLEVRNSGGDVDDVGAVIWVKWRE